MRCVGVEELPARAEGASADRVQQLRGVGDVAAGKAAAAGAATRRNVLVLVEVEGARRGGQQQQLGDDAHAAGSDTCTLYRTTLYLLPKRASVRIT